MPTKFDHAPDARPHVETPRQILEARMEAAGLRVSAYLRRLPIPETQRHELALATLRRLAENPGENPDQATANGMAILRDLLTEITVQPVAIPGPGLKRSHMRPEEMDRRPWVRAWMRVWRPLWLGLANLLNKSYLDILLYALLLACLYFLAQSLRP